MDDLAYRERLEIICASKAAFLTKDEAKRTKHVMAKKAGRKVSVYRCQNCYCYHLTSQKESD